MVKNTRLSCNIQSHFLGWANPRNGGRFILNAASRAKNLGYRKKRRLKYKKKEKKNPLRNKDCARSEQSTFLYFPERRGKEGEIAITRQHRVLCRHGLGSLPPI